MRKESDKSHLDATFISLIEEYRNTWEVPFPEGAREDRQQLLERLADKTARDLLNTSPGEQKDLLCAAGKAVQVNTIVPRELSLVSDFYFRTILKLLSQMRSE